MAATSTNAFYYKNKAKEVKGPYRLEDINKLILKREILKNTPFSTDGLVWQKAVKASVLKRSQFQQAKKLHRNERRFNQFIPSFCFFVLGFISLYIVIDVVITLHWLADVAIVLASAVVGGLAGLRIENYIKAKYGQQRFIKVVRWGIVGQAALLWFIFPFFIAAVFMTALWLALLISALSMAVGIWLARRRLAL